MEGTPIPLALPVKRTPTTTREGIAYEVRALLVANWASGEREKRPSKVPNASHETGGLCLRRACLLRTGSASQQHTVTCSSSWSRRRSSLRQC